MRGIHTMGKTQPILKTDVTPNSQSLQGGKTQASVSKTERRQRFVIQIVGVTPRYAELIKDLFKTYQGLNYIQVRGSRDNLFLCIQMTLPTRLSPLCEFIQTYTTGEIITHDFKYEAVYNEAVIYTYGEMRSSGGDRKSVSAVNRRIGNAAKA